MKGEVEWNGNDATEKVADMVTSSPYSEQIRYVFLDRLNLAGSNNIDLIELYKVTRIPIFLVIKSMIGPFAGELPKGGFITVNSVRFFTVSIEKDMAKNIIKASWGDGKIPETLMVAGRIATAYNRLLKSKRLNPSATPF